MEEAFPRRVGFRSGDVHAEHSAVPVGVDSGGEQSWAFDHPAAVTDFVHEHVARQVGALAEARGRF